MSNARFWVWVGSGPVKLTLRDGERITHARFKTDEEGWSRLEQAWAFDGSVVTWEQALMARDCDGRIDRYSVVECPLERLRAIECSVEYHKDTGNWPVWKNVDYSQRDYQAEAAGY